MATNEGDEAELHEPKRDAVLACPSMERCDNKGLIRVEQKNHLQKSMSNHRANRTEPAMHAACGGTPPLNRT